METVPDIVTDPPAATASGTAATIPAAAAAPVIFPNHINYLYPIAATTGQQFVLFNPAVHYWVALNGAAAQIVRALSTPRTLADLRDALGMDAAAFSAAVLPLVDDLLHARFLVTTPPSGSTGWVPAGAFLETPDAYPFESLIVSLGDGCNLACRYCFNAGHRAARLQQPRTARLTQADYARLFGEFRALGGASLLITGGEPTLNPDFLAICGDARRAGLTVRIITNGTRLARFDPHRFVEAVDQLAVSLDSADDDVNAALWGVDGHRFAQDILAPLAALARTPRQDGSRLDVAIKPTITRRNLDLLPALLRAVGRALAGCTWRLDVTRYAEIGDAAVDGDLAISEAEYEQALYRAHGELAGGPPSPLAAEEFALSQGGKAGAMDRPRVLSCVPSLFVTAAGDVYPCQPLETEAFHLGNIGRTSLAGAFRAPAFEALRRKMSRDHIDRCGACELRYVCTDHCHAKALERTGRTDGFMHDDDTACRQRAIRRLWISTQLPEAP